MPSNDSDEEQPAVTGKQTRKKRAPKENVKNNSSKLIDDYDMLATMELQDALE